jgi:hypothetical protein
LTHVVAATENFIRDLIALANISNDNLLTFSDHDAIDGASVMGRARTAPT